jgi:TfoX/Sxy family transcriptional regulator of competence genes
MAYDEKLAQRVRLALSNRDDVEEKKMMGGLAFMVDDKMCLGIMRDELMCRIDPEVREKALSRDGCRVMDFTGKPMKGFVLVNEVGFQSKKDFSYWVNLALEFNPKAKSSKKKS